MDKSVIISPDDYDAVIFDLDGVVTDTSRVHAAAWKRLFDEYQDHMAAMGRTPYRPFDEKLDYLKHVDGKPRCDGVADFLKSREVVLPWGSPQDSPETETVCGLGNRKNLIFNEEIRSKGVDVYPSSVEFIKAVRGAGLRTGIVSSSKNCLTVLQLTGLESLFETRVDGLEAVKLNLPGKPHPAMYLEAARRLEVSPSRAVVVEDAISGVQSGRAGHFRLVIGVNRDGNRRALEANGAHVVVDDLGELAVKQRG